jgi:glycosyltransferase involved in cell wall biosynthesis
VKIGIFHWTFDFVGGGEILANYLGKALNAKVYSILKNDNLLGFTDLSTYIPFPANYLRKIRSFDYLTWSAMDIDQLDDFDLIISSGAGTRGLITRDDIIHINFCHSTPRWLYDLWHHRLRTKSSIKKTVLVPGGEFFRIWDNAVDKRVDYYLCNSPIVRRRLWKYLKRDSKILFPPIETEKYKFNEYGNFYLFMSRLEEEKRPENAIEACIRSNKQLIILGKGLLDKKLRLKYEDNPLINFMGHVTDAEKIKLLSDCKAVIYPAIAEDFGIVPIEALASGKPVITSNDGFPPTLINNKNGVITDGSVTGIEEAMHLLEQHDYDPDKIMEMALSFDYKVFQSKLKKYIEEFKEDFKNR